MTNPVHPYSSISGELKEGDLIGGPYNCLGIFHNVNPKNKTYRWYNLHDLAFFYRMIQDKQEHTPPSLSYISSNKAPYRIYKLTLACLTQEGKDTYELAMKGYELIRNFKKL